MIFGDELCWKFESCLIAATSKEAAECMERILDGQVDNAFFAEFDLKISIPMIHGYGNTSIQFNVTINSTPEQFAKFKSRVGKFIEGELNILRDGY